MRFSDRPLTRPSRRFVTRLICATLATLLFWLPASQVAYAQDPEGEYSGSYTTAQLRDDVAESVQSDLIEGSVGESIGVRDPSQIQPVTDGAPTDTPAEYDAAAVREAISLPGSAGASAVTPQAISLPNAEGSVEGMGESFSPVLSSGTATFSVPIAVAPGRAGVQPSLALSYATTGGNGPVGFGWHLGAPFISRQTDRGLPHYIDQAAWHPREDRFMYNGGQELVPVDDTAIGIIDSQANGGTAPAIPIELSGWQQYRARVEGGFMRFFRSPDSNRWVVQSKDGTRFDFGRIESGAPSEITTGSSNALERDPERTTGGVYRWCLTRMSDAHGSTVYYLYDQRDGHSYLSEVYYVSPSSCATASPEPSHCTQPLSAYGARVRLVYESRGDVFSSYVAGWRIDTARRLKRVEVTAWEDDVSARTLVRRYHLTYATDSFHSLLQQVQVEGRPQTFDSSLGANVGSRTVLESSLGSTIVGELLPPMTFRYSAMPGGGIPGFGTISSSVQSVVDSPPHSVDEGRSDLFDVNSDGLPDLIVTDPARYRTSGGGPAVGVFFNGFTGTAARPAGAAAHFSGAVPMGVRSDLATVLNLSNLNVVPMDIDGDGRSDLLHMPRIRNYGWWAPTRRADATSVATVSPAEQGWEWTYAQVSLPASDTDPRIDLGRDSSHVRVLDVNNDHLIDVVRTTGTVMQTWVNLGYLPGGDGRFGSYTWNGTDHDLSTLPFESCLLQGGTPIDFDDPEVRLSDMNGDGLQDIAQIRRGRVIYWPGRGEGVWGEGSRSCARGEGAGRYIEMATPPPELAIDLDGVYLEDVNMDGATDLVQVRFREIDVWFNRAGRGWTPRTTVRGTPATPSFAPRIRFADIDGSSTTDIIWGNAHAWEYIDLTDGRRPRLLIGVDNGLGADTTIDYASSAQDYVSDLQAADACSAETCDRFTWTHAADGPDERLCELSRATASPQCNADESNRGEWLIRSSGSPVVSTIVRGVSTTDRFNVLGREAQVTESQFAYHDGYYEGIEQEFRGFGAADAVTVGDWNNPTVYSRTHFLQGRRPHSIADDRLADNPDEALKGREVMTEVFDDEGRFLTTSWAAITNRYLTTGQDGRAIHYAYVTETNELRYDHSPYEADGTTLTAPAVVRQVVDPTTGQLGDADPITSGTQLTLTEQSRTIAIRGARAARVRATFDSVDNLGHVLQQTAHGQVAVSDASAVDGLIVSHTEPELMGTGASWIWRTGRTYLTGHDTASNLGDTTNSYNAVGDLTSAAQAVVSPLPHYAFEGEASIPNEGGAAGFTQADEPLVASTFYDTWGNARASCAGGIITSETFSTECLRFGSVTYDTTYSQLAETESLRVGPGSPSTDVLTYSGTWDRGLGAVLSSEDPNDLVTTVTYDGLGRLTSVVAPNVDACTGTTPSTRIAYHLTTNPLSQPISRVETTNELNCTGGLGEEGGSLRSIAYVDGLGRARAALSTGEDASGDRQWVRAGITTLDKKGTVRRTYQSDYHGGSETAYSAIVALPADIPYAVTRYDAFGRAKGVHAEDGAVTWTSYHALSTDVCDPLDNDPSSEHYRTCTSATTDGHGRVVDQVLRNRHPDFGTAETYRLWTYYRADGAVLALVRTQADTSTPRAGMVAGLPTGLPPLNVVRTFTYDTVGRRLSSRDPDTDNPAGTAEARSWRYLFNKVGDLVAVRDPRGCGQNFFYDFGGRLVGEQYVSCGEAQSHVLERPHPDNVVGNLIALEYPAGTEDVWLDVVYHYDEYPDWVWVGAPPASIVPSTASAVRGRATGVSDRGQRAVLAYDDRGNVTWTARQMALISDELGAMTGAPTLDGTGRPATDDDETPPAAPGNVLYDQAHTYTREASFDHAGRPLQMVLPLDPDYGGTAPEVTGALTYNRRGLPATASAGIGGVTQTIVASIEYLRDGLVSSITYGDDAGGRIPTTSTTTYDIRRRPVRFRTTRTATGTVADSLAAVTLPVDQQLVWDAANNLVAQIDHRSAAEWPLGHRPQSVNIRHDSLYRVVGAEFDYTQPGGTREPYDVGTDWRNATRGFGATRAHDPMRQAPAPMVTTMTEVGGSVPIDRVASLTWTWDYLANTTETTDNESRFYERSLGTITNGDDEESATLRPSALYLASNIGTGTSLDGGSGWVEVDYGAGGNVEAMTVHAQCVNATGYTCSDPTASSVDTRRSTLRTNCACAVEQHYVYRWDELNRLAEARRYDRSGGGSWTIEVRQRYRYDAANVRTVKQTLDQDATSCGGTAPCERIALYVYPGDFERRGLVRDTVWDEYDADSLTETQYVVAGARTVWSSATVLGSYDRDHRLTVGLTDLIQTTAAVLDVRTGALLEASTYYPNGARETYLVDDGTATAPEVAGFTGKEGDEEVGVVYFGERYLIPRLGRWASPDPLHVHAVAGGVPLNSYHYITGNLLASLDADGLSEASYRASIGPAQEAAAADARGETLTDAQRDALRAHGREAADFYRENEYLAFVWGFSAEDAEGNIPFAIQAYNDAGWFNSGRAVPPPTIHHPLVDQAYDERIQQTAASARARIQEAAGLRALVEFDRFLEGHARARRRIDPNDRSASDHTPRSRRSRASPSVRRGQCEGGRCGGPGVCFAGGTPVRTASGYRDIEHVELGDIVEVPSQIVSECRSDQSAVPMVRIALRAHNPSAPDDQIEVELLRPHRSWWGRLLIGDDVVVLMEEFGGNLVGTVVSVERAAPVVDGCRTVVGRVRHRSDQVLTLTYGSIEDERRSTGNLVLTEAHRLYSETRGAWIRAADAQRGELLRTRLGAVMVVDVDDGPSGILVYNLELSAGHEYYVTRDSILTHNTNCSDFTSELGVSPTTARSRLNARTPGQGGQAHHVIPWEARSHTVVRLAAKVGFNINGAENGIRMPTADSGNGGGFHRGSHPAYNARIINRLNQVLAAHPGLTAQQAAEHLRAIVAGAREGLRRREGRLR